MKRHSQTALGHAFATAIACAMAARSANSNENKVDEFADEFESFSHLREHRVARIEFRNGGLETWAGKQISRDGRHETLNSREVNTRSTYALRIISTHRKGEILTVGSLREVCDYAARWNIRICLGSQIEFSVGAYEMGSGR